jgi:ribosome biogenesis GTPase / thiamine phosphate phosphatase
VLVAAEPVFSESQLARALIAAADAGIPARIVLNKADLPSIESARQRLRPYAAMGTPVHEVALKRDSAAAMRARASCDSLNTGSAATSTSSWSMLANARRW